MQAEVDTATRIAAARILRGISREELTARLVDAGFSLRLANRLQRGHESMKAAHQFALSQALGFPPRWFVDPVDDLCPDELPEELTRRLDRIERLLESR